MYIRRPVYRQMHKQHIFSRLGEQSSSDDFCKRMSLADCLGQVTRKAIKRKNDSYRVPWCHYRGFTRENTTPSIEDRAQNIFLHWVRTTIQLLFFWTNPVYDYSKNKIKIKINKHFLSSCRCRCRWAAFHVNFLCSKSAFWCFWQEIDDKILMRRKRKPVIKNI